MRAVTWCSVVTGMLSCLVPYVPWNRLQSHQDPVLDKWLCDIDGYYAVAIGFLTDGENSYFI